MDSIETHMTNMEAIMKNLEVRIGKLAISIKSQQQGKFPSDTEVNLKKHCKDITLRSGTKIGESMPIEVMTPIPDKEEERLNADQGNQGEKNVEGSQASFHIIP